MNRRVGRRGPPREGDGLAQLVPARGPEQAGSAGAFRKVWVACDKEPRQQVVPRAAVLVLPTEEQAQLGISKPGVVIQRIALQNSLPGDPRLFQLPLPYQFRWHSPSGI